MDLQNFQSKSKCPRCDSLHTKFCYYNNYNYSQPRHFCKSCRRYWTIGGVLRNVPVGGGTRKSKNSKPKPATTIVRDSPSWNSEILSPIRLLAGAQLGCIDGTTPLKLNQAADCDPARSEGMDEILSGVDGDSWFKFCGSSALFNN